ncbi:hypothetical protein GCM10020219_100770 [Nonomuraea dietziae]
MREARPTAVNLAWGVDQAAAHLEEGRQAVLARAERLRDEDIAACVAMGGRGADLIEGDSLRVMTICNTGALAAVERGHGAGRHPDPARARQAGRGAGAGDQAAAAGRAAHRMGAGQDGARRTG